MKHKKMLLGVLGSLACFIILLVGFMVLLPYLINLEPIREEILAVLSEQVGGKVEYQKLDLSYFPLPRVKIHQVTLSIPEKATGTLTSVQVYPKLLAFLRGKMSVNKIEIESPDVSIRLPKGREKTREKPERSLFEEIGGAIAQVSTVASTNFPNLNGVVKNGSLNVYEESQVILSFSNLDGRVLFSPGDIQMAVSCRSNLWDRMSAKATVNPVDFKGHGEVDLVNFYPHVLTDSLVPIAPLRIKNSRVNLKISFRTEGPGTLETEVEGSIPLLSFHQKNKEVTIKGKNLRGSFQMEGKRVNISLTELNLDDPKLKLLGKFQIDQKEPLAVLEVEGRDVDVVSTREVVLTLTGELPITKTIFTIVRGGRVPRITFQSRGRSVADLDETENFSINGSLQEGKIFISEEVFGWKGINFDLEKVSGEVALAKGIFGAKNVRARMENVEIREGQLRVGLEGENPLLHLEVVTEVDLSLLPPLLNRVIKNRTFLEEMARLAGIKGRAVGNLVVGESTRTIKAKIDIQDIQLLARYDRIPYSVTINRGEVSFDGEKLGVRNLIGKVGNSSFSDVAARIGFGREPPIEVFSGSSTLSLEEIYPWFSSYGSLQKAFKNFKSVKGRLSLSDMRLTGPLKSPEKWDFSTTGDLKDLVVNTSLLPGPFAMTSGKFKLDPEKIIFTDLQTRFLDALLQVSGTLYDYQRGLEKAELDFSGRVTPKDIQWFSDSLGMERRFQVRSPIQISKAHLSWRKSGETTFKGILAMLNGPEISLDVSRNPQELKVNNLVIHDELSHAAIGLDLKGKRIGLAFSGRLSEKTLDKIFASYQFQDGWIRGDFRTNLNLDQPARSTAQGKLEADHLSFPWQFEKPLEIDDISLDAKGNRITVLRANVAWGGKRFSLSGDVRFSDPKMLLDISLSTESVDLGELEELPPKEKEAKRERDSKGLPLEGVIRFKSNSLKYGRFTWEPFRADITVGKNGVEVNVEEAKLCGISTPGVVKVIDQELSLDIRPVFRSRELESTAKCLLDQEIRATGDFDFSGRISAQGKPEDLMNTLRGDVELEAKDGRIYYQIGLYRILEFVNVTEVYKGKLPNLREEGLAYKLATMKGFFQNGKLIIKEATLDGPTLEMAGQGEIDLAEGKVNLTVLVAPLKTVDRVIKSMPLVNYILAGTLVTVPVRLRGDLKDPRVTPLSPSAVGSELLGIMKRTLGLPFKIIDPFRPRKKEEIGEPLSGEDKQ